MGQLNNSRAKASKTLDVLAIPHEIATVGTTPFKVGKGNLCRIEGATGAFIRFAIEGDTTAPSSSTRETLKTPNDFFFVSATEDYLICSTNLRVEIIKD